MKYRMRDKIEGVEITPATVGDFFILNRGKSLKIDPATWQIKVDGLVRRSLVLSCSDLRTAGSSSVVATMECIANPVGGRLIGTAIWDGVPLREILKKASIKSEAGEVAFHSLDGFTTGLSLLRAFKPNVILALFINGELLAKEYGGPVRLVNPGQYGFQWPKWITHIEAVPEGYGKEYWGRQNIAYEPEVKITSAIRMPEDGERLSKGVHKIQGIAFAGEKAVSRVEVSLNGGRSWCEAVLETPSLPCIWVRWSCEWVSPQSGRYQLIVRAIDKSGEVQSPSQTPVLPDGASGWHRVECFIEN